MPHHIIDRIQKLADTYNQNPAINFLDYNGNPTNYDEFDDLTDNNDEISEVENTFPINPVGVDANPGVNPRRGAVEIPYETINFYNHYKPDNNPPNANPDAAMPLLPPPPLYTETNPIVPKVEPEPILVDTVITDDKSDNKNTHYPPLQRHHRQCQPKQRYFQLWQ